ncbi:MAG TPA: hypothetical protein VHK24_07430 [Steroidobacter sp.]|jgi:DNA-binding response OmpR family regulator|nr:hypothetical protein [Steroidobacter sp.]
MRQAEDKRLASVAGFDHHLTKPVTLELLRSVVRGIVRDVANSPGAADRQLMTELAIDFKDGVYLFEGFWYENLVDAANYARLRQRSDVTRILSFEH